MHGIGERRIVAHAPGRCGIVGNPTDMYGGSVLSISTRERAFCTLSPAKTIVLEAGDERAHIASEDDLELRGDRLDLPRAALKYLGPHVEGGFVLSLSTEIPMRAGLAGSTALMVALVGALDLWFGWEMNPWMIAETARRIEANILGVMCGFQDQHMAVFGGINYMDFRGKEFLQQRPGEPLATVEPLTAYVTVPPLVAAHTGIQRHSGQVHSSPRERWLAGDEKVRRAYSRIADLARAGKKALLHADWPSLGALMNENQDLVADLGGSGPENDRLIEVARRAGAWGAKLAGAGGGGTILALAEDPHQMADTLLAAGADRVLFPNPERGLTVTDAPEDP
ncbi:MAG: hypothetical protein ACP5VE_09185 [Chthonomonadales bacterium]